MNSVLMCRTLGFLQTLCLGDKMKPWRRNHGCVRENLFQTLHCDDITNMKITSLDSGEVLQV